jgi:hypothetical protein
MYPFSYSSAKKVCSISRSSVVRGYTLQSKTLGALGINRISSSPCLFSRKHLACSSLNICSCHLYSVGSVGILASCRHPLPIIEPLRCASPISLFHDLTSLLFGAVRPDIYSPIVPLDWTRWFPLRPILLPASLCTNRCQDWKGTRTGTLRWSHPLLGWWGKISFGLGVLDNKSLANSKTLSSQYSFQSHPRCEW